LPQNVGICLLVAESGLVKLRTRAHDLLLAVLCVYLQGRDERRNNVTLPVVGENRLMDVQCNTSPSSLVIGMIMIESRTYRIVAMNHRDTFKCLHFRLALFPCPHRQVPPSSSAICLSVSGQCLCAMRGSQALQCNGRPAQLQFDRWCMPADSVYGHITACHNHYAVGAAKTDAHCCCFKMSTSNTSQQPSKCSRWLYH